MDEKTYEEIQIHTDDIDNKLFLSEGMTVKMFVFRDRIISVELPNTAVYTVVSLGNLMFVLIRLCGQ